MATAKNYAKAGLAVAQAAYKTLSLVNPTLPEPTLETYDKTFLPALGIGPLRNQFIGLVINGIGEAFVAPKMARDSLEDIREYRNDLRPVSEIYLEDAELLGYGGDDVVKGEYAQIYLNMLQYTKVMNYLGRYQCTTGMGGNFDMIVGGIFNNLEEIGRFAEKVANNIEMTSRVDDYTIFIALLQDRMLQGSIYVLPVDLSGDDEQKGKNIIKAVRKASMQLESNDPKRKYTDFGNRDFVPKEDQLLIMGQTDTINVDVDTLAGIFNLSKAEFEVKRFLVDELYEQGSRIDEVRRVNPNIRKLTDEESTNLKALHAVVCNKRFFQIVQYLRSALSTDINSAMLKNVFMHVGNHFGTSPLASAIAIVDKAAINPADTVEYSVTPVNATDPRVKAFSLSGPDLLTGNGINMVADNANMMNNIVITKSGMLMIPANAEAFYLYGELGDAKYKSQEITLDVLTAEDAKITFTKQ